MEKAEISKKKKDEGREMWNEWFENKGVGDDFMNDRDQPEHQERVFSCFLFSVNLAGNL